MRVILDSNVFLSALLSPGGPQHRIYEAWRGGRFDIAICTEQIEELRRASRYPKFRGILQPHRVGLMLNNLQRAEVFDRLPAGHEATDPQDAYLLALAEVSSAQYLVTGDKRAGLLQRRSVGAARIVTATVFCGLVL
ncbi:putative toxin-antitoxin system toxin component, PIN family [Inquilinus sp. NPDC058860]|uniref:putative toxin-antitoxin system toxin component, PIN family n=1 Tax=Inquilinus sp. NPDC058860 TaxID=3346652 RepID=UPI003691CB9F